MRGVLDRPVRFFLLFLIIALAHFALLETMFAQRLHVRWTF